MTAANAPAPPMALHQVTLVELVDRLLGAGVVAAGDLTLSAANVDLVHVNLRALIASAGTLASGGVVPATESRPAPAPLDAGSRTGVRAAPSPRPRPVPAPRRRAERNDRRIDADPEHLEQGLAQLVLTLVELLRELMERQAIRRIDDGTLTDEEVDRLGETFMLLEQRMGELKDVFGLTDQDLNLDLGPLGTLL
jgi:NTP pyrophosphatase (non-canonical NTP hydrolase)